MNVVEIVFSPTGGTEKTADIIGKHWDENPVKIDLSDANVDFSKCEINEQNIVIIAMPSFGGRAPAVAIERLRKIHGNGAKCVLVCVYGNSVKQEEPTRKRRFYVVFIMQRKHQTDLPFYLMFFQFLVQVFRKRKP